MSTLEHAIQIAAAAHAGQIDQAGEPYILHPLRVMLALKHPNERMAAVLHDVVEDTEVSIEQLVAEGFPAPVIDAVEALTKRPGESRMDAARRASVNPLARRVKLADNADNMDPARLPNPTDRDRARLEEYRVVRAFLLSQAPG